MVAPEMLPCMSDEAFEILAMIFRKRILNTGTVAADCVWDQNEILLLRKVPNPMHVKQYRGIGLLQPTYKLYTSVLVRVCGLKHLKLRTPQFAARPGHSVDEVTFILRQIIEKCNEYEQPLFILDGDVENATIELGIPRS